jgi:hypothetical protein
LNTPCILHTGGWFTDKGYGMLRVGTERKKVRAHRWAYCVHNKCTLASIEGLSVRHSCDNPPCVNPEHLLLGSHLDNMRDKKERGRAPGAKGEANATAKLTAAQVREIRTTCVKRSKEFSAAALARKFGVTKSLVCMILAGKGWSHI